MKFNCIFGFTFKLDKYRFMGFIKSGFSLRTLNLPLLLLIAFTQIQAQQTFHRLYPTKKDKDIIGINAIQIKSGEYISIQLEVEENANPDTDDFSDTLVISSYQYRGDLKWTKSIALQTPYKSLKLSQTSIIQAANDSLYYALVALNNNQPVIILGSISSGGTSGFLKSYDLSGDSDYSVTDYNLLTSAGTGVYNAFTAIVDDEQSVIFSKLDTTGQVEWTIALDAKNNGNDNQDEKITDMVAVGNEIVMTGVVDSSDSNVFMAVIDSLGKPLMGKRYFENGGTGTTPVNSKIQRLADASFVIAGNLSEVSSPGSVSVQRGFVIKTDKNGDVQWSKKAIYQTDGFNLIKDVAVDRFDNIILYGEIYNADTTTIIPYMMKVKPGGEIVWQKKYDRATGSLNKNGTVFETLDASFAAFGTSLNDAETKYGLSFIKADINGASGCENNLGDTILVDLAVTQDTLIFDTRNFSLNATNVDFKSNLYELEVPGLMLQSKQFCKNEPIDWTLNATAPNAVAYKWSDGSTGSTLRVTEEGEYAVTVTIETDYCFVLIDTAKIERYPEPTIFPYSSLGSFCQTGQILLSANPVVAGGLSYNILWNTGETNRDFPTDKTGTYTVTVTDACNLSASGSISIPELPKKITAARIEGAPVSNCLKGTINGQLQAYGNSTGLGPDTYTWSTGQLTQFIDIANAEVFVYTVTVTDGCGETATAEKSIPLSGAAINPDITAERRGECKDRFVAANVVLSEFSNKIKYSWSTGATTPDVRLTEPGTYTVTITDACGNEINKSVEVGKDLFSTPDLVYGKIFFPDGTFSPGIVLDTAVLSSDNYKNAEQYNRSFGPVDLESYCLQDITDYEMYVFNRWGQEVFKSDNVAVEWDGTFKGQPAPTEAYLWVVRYKIYDEVKTLKGSVTLIRL